VLAIHSAFTKIAKNAEPILNSKTQRNRSGSKTKTEKQTDKKINHCYIQKEDPSIYAPRQERQPQ